MAAVISVIKTQLNLTISGVDSLESEEIPFDLRGLSWMFRIRRSVNNGSDAVSVDLERKVGTRDDKYMATALIEIQHHDETILLGYIQPDEFSTLHNKKYAVFTFFPTKIVQNI